MSLLSPRNRRSIDSRIVTRSDLRRVGRWDLGNDSSDWSNGIRYHTFDTKPDTAFNHPPPPGQAGRPYLLHGIIYDKLLSSVACKFCFRPYTLASAAPSATAVQQATPCTFQAGPDAVSPFQRN